MTTTLIKDILATEPTGQEFLVKGWVRTKRDLKNLVFIELNDGSCFKSIQCTFDRTNDLDAATLSILEEIGTGASASIRGTLTESPAAGQAVEITAKEIVYFGTAESDSYPLQKKRHSFEFLREIAHLRARTNTFAAVARIRSRLSFAVHEFFYQNGFQYIHTPIITASDCEGAGAMFQVTTLNLDKVQESDKKVDYSRDFFGKPSYLTVSGQLEAETYATALSRVYTFGPTFRAENSNTTRHLAEFWMIEPEIAFAHLEENMDLAESFLKYLFTTVLKDCSEDLEFFDSRIQKGVMNTLKSVAESKFSHMSYSDAMKELEKKADSFEFKPYWGCDLQSEHEKYLTETVVKGPLIVTDYPKEIKAFYMKMNEDGKTVRAMDVLVPRLGEIIGGSEREENLGVLEQRIRDNGMKPEDYWWYLDLRRFGTVPHAGFGLGFERLILYVTGMTNIRDVIPYPRAVGQAEF